MKNRIKIFENAEFGKVRVNIVNNEPMFCLSDVCKVLGLTQPSKVKERLNEKGVNTIPTLTSGGTQELLYINESNLYKTIFQSRKECAERFSDWVTSEVLPSIRKNGGYIMEKQDETPEELMARALMIAQETLKRKEQRLLEAETKIKENAPKVEYFNGLIERGNNLNFRDTAKLLGVKEKTFIYILIDKGYIYRDAKGKLKPIAKYVGKYFELKEWVTNDKSGTQTLITVTGREKFASIIKEYISESLN